MQDNSQSSLRTPDPTPLQALGFLVQHFNSAWRSGSRPSIEDYLRKLPPADHVELLGQLVLLDWQYRVKAGELPTRREYLDRFRGHAVLICDLDLGHTSADHAMRDQARPEAPITLPVFVNLLVTSGLMTDAEVNEFHQTLAAEGQPRSTWDLANALVRAEKLTRYQAQSLCEGHATGLVLGNYVLLDKLGSGGMGDVYKALHRRMDRLVALKTLASDVVDSPLATKRFLREVKAAAKLNHPNIVTAYDSDVSAGTHFLVMEYVDGENLSTFLLRHRALSVEQAIDFLMQISHGLLYAHDQGVVHRDIKPANLLLDRKGFARYVDRASKGATIKILDMGLARFPADALLQGDDVRSETLTADGHVVGTVSYMSPEQAISPHSVDHRSDIYSLGCTFYRMLAGHPPYRGQTAMQTLLLHRDAAIPSLVEHRPDVPPALDTIYQKMVAKDPSDRYQTIRELLDDVQRVVGDLPSDRPAAIPDEAKEATEGALARNTEETVEWMTELSTGVGVHEPPAEPGSELELQSVSSDDISAAHTQQSRAADEDKMHSVLLGPFQPLKSIYEVLTGPLPAATNKLLRSESRGFWTRWLKLPKETAIVCGGLAALVIIILLLLYAIRS